MKLKLQESKEALPISFLTTLVSKSWDDVGVLKAELEGIRKEFSGTKKIEEVIQGLIDAYLVFIGQVELHMSTKDYLDYPDESALAEVTEPVKESLTEDLTEDDVTVNIDDVNVVVEPVAEAEKPVEQPVVKASGVDALAQETAPKCDDYEFFCDFDEPDLSVPKVTDKDLYPND